MTGTSTELTFAMRCMPPKTMMSVSTASTTPVAIGFQPNAPSIAPQIVFVCTELFARPNDTVINIAKSTAIHRQCRPR